MRQLLIVRDEMGNIDVAVVLLDQDVLSNLVSARTISLLAARSPRLKRTGR